MPNAGRPVGRLDADGQLDMGAGAGLSRRRLVGAAASAAAAAATGAGVGPLAGGRAATAGRRLLQAQSDPATLTIAADGSPSDLDPHTAADYRSVLAILGVYETLIALDGESTDRYVGVLAESWEPNADGSVWTFRLRDGVTFHDGSPCDAEAVRASFERYMTTGYGSTIGWTRFVADPSRITAPDPRTVVFDLGRPQPLFEAAMAGTYGVYVVNAAAMREYEEEGDWGHAWAQTNADGTGTGPYRLVQFDPAEQLVMERNDAYWGGWEGDHFERIVIRVVPENGTRRQLLEQGEVDLVDALTVDDLRAVGDNPNLTLHQGYTTRVEYFYMTVGGPLETPEARQALCYAFPYDDVIAGVFQGFAKRAIGPVAEPLRGFNPDTFTYATDLERARDLLARAGVAPGTALEMAIEPGDENVKTIAQLFQANLAEIGIQLDISQVETSSYVGILYGDSPAEERPNLMWWAWWPSYNDTWAHLRDLVSCDAWGSLGGNAGLYCNDDVEALLEETLNAPNDAAYDRAAAELQQAVSRDDPPAIYYAQIEQTVVTGNDIQGVVLNPINVGTYYFYDMSRRG